VPDALHMAVTTRTPADVVHRSDRGRRCKSIAFGSTRAACHAALVSPRAGAGADRAAAAAGRTAPPPAP
jgi:hypothetical protein